MSKIVVRELQGAELALWAARANGRETRENIKLYAAGPCLYRDLGRGATPYHFRPDSNLEDAASLIGEMTQAGELRLDARGATLSVPGWGTIGFEGRPAEAATRCYVAWKLGDEFESENSDTRQQGDV
jgi:hypothetical protein